MEHDVDRARFQKDINEGFRRMKIKDFFYPDSDSRSVEEKRFYVKKDDWEPSKVNRALDVHNMVIQNKFDHWKQPNRIKDNLSVTQRKAPKSLSNDDKIDIKLDDKSECFVVADMKDYVSAATNDLRKQPNIREINVNSVTDGILETEAEIAHVVDACLESGEILQSAVRGIVSCSGTADENLADFLDFVLNPRMKQLRAYLKGTKDFLLWLEEFRVQYPQLPPLFLFSLWIIAVCIPACQTNSYYLQFRSIWMPG